MITPSNTIPSPAGGEGASGQIAVPLDEPLKQLRFEEALRKLTKHAWGAWIWGSPRDGVIYLIPAQPEDCELATSLGLRVSPSIEGLTLLFAGHETEAT